jgi:RNA polymerase sigma-70 factor (sigma-E family)
MSTEPRDSLAAPAPPPRDACDLLAGQADAAGAVTALYEAHALGLVRLAYVMLGNRASAEDVVQEAFCGLYRRWGQLADRGRALQYVRSSVLNGCRTVLRQRPRPCIPPVDETSATSAEAAVLAIEEHREVMRALRRLPERQREALVLRFYLDEPEAEIARLMSIRPGTVRSTTHRALSALGRLLRETS